MKADFRKRVYFGSGILIANVIGAVIFLRIASHCWVDSGEAELTGMHTDGWKWLFTAVPVLLLFILLNVGVLIWAVLYKPRALGVSEYRWSLRELPGLWASVPIWLLALVVDRFHHRISILMSYPLW